MSALTVNGNTVNVDTDLQTPLLWILREDLGLTGTKYGCGVASCGACTVHLDGQAIYACQTPLAAVVGKTVTTIEGLSPTGDHALQRAWIAEQVPQCGYCQSGQIMRAAALLSATPRPTRSQIVDTMSANLCRCGTYSRIVRAIERVAKAA